jgi:hypothetical protein
MILHIHSDASYLDAGVTFHSGELSEPSLPLVNCILDEDDIPGLNAVYYQATYYPLGDLSGE